MTDGWCGSLFLVAFYISINFHSKHLTSDLQQLISDMERIHQAVGGVKVGRLCFHLMTSGKSLSRGEKLTLYFFIFFAFFQLGMQNVFPENLSINLVYPAWKEALCSFWTGEAKTWQGKHSVMSHFGTREFASPARGL